MHAAFALGIVLLGQIAFWALLNAGGFWSALGANAAFWCLAFPLWTMAARRRWRGSATPDIALGLLLILVTAGCFYLAQGLSDAAYCTSVLSEHDPRCWVSPAARDAFLWVGLTNVPVAAVATSPPPLRARALRVAAEASADAGDKTPGPKPVTALVIAAVILGVALVAFAVLIVANAGPPR